MREDTRRRGIALALVTAAVSGVAVYVNGNGVRAVGDATVYTTAKNLVAAVVLAIGAVVVSRRRRARTPAPSVTAGSGWRGVLVAVVGGSIPFVLFFEGLARADSADAAFIHKTLVVWVALLAGPVLGERLASRHVVAVGLLLAGYVGLVGGVPEVGFGAGEAMIGVATLLWAVEVVVAKRFLAETSAAGLATWRMGGGVALLLGWLAVTGRAGSLGGLDATAWGWALATGVLLAAYVAGWYGALALAPAVDVTAVLVGGAILTALLRVFLDGAPLAVDAPWLGLLAGGVAVATAGRRLRPRAPVSA